MSFLNSDIVKNFEKGELPEIKANVSIEKESLVNLYVGVFIIVALGILISRLTR